MRNSSGQRFDTAEIHAAPPARRERRRKERRKREPRVPRWVYRVILILLLSVGGMLLWFNRSNLTPANIAEWVQTRAVGLGMGDGFPYSVTGSSISPGNFKSAGKNAVFVRDTELTVLNSTARELFSRQHSFSSPVMKAAGLRVLVYSLGGKGYQIESQSGTLVRTEAQQNILAGALAENGRYALITQEDGYCGRLTAYTADNKEQFRYWFSEYYPTAVALSSDGSGAAVTAVSTQGGGVVSAVYLLNFSSTKPVQPVAVDQDNLLLDVSYAADGTITAVGDRKTVVVKADHRTKAEYDYQGLHLAAYDLNDGRAALSLSAYRNSSDSRLVVVGRDGRAAFSASLQQSVKSVSLFGGAVGALAGSRVLFYSAGTGQSLGNCSAGGDARAVALRDESSAYILGVSEIRLASLA